MRYTIPILALALSAATSVQAQEATRSSWRPELRPFIGASIPTGAQRDAINSDILFGLQAAAELRPTFHAVGSFGFTAAETKHPTPNRDVAVLQYDVGVEFSRVAPLTPDWQFRPFLGLGGGARTYLYAADALKDRTCGLAYGTVGTEFQIGRSALRAELRDNVFCYRAPIVGVKSRTRNDLGLAFGFAYHFR
jgi:hypothetical protein